MQANHNFTKVARLGAFAAAIFFAGCAGNKDSQQTEATRDPVYETALQIKGMRPCNARVVERGPCYVHLKSANGKGFYLGSPGSEPEVGRFIAVLKLGPMYRFPDAFT